MSYDRDLFITEINLTEFAASMGYQIDRSKSTKSSIVMKGAADKVVIKKKSGKWVYFSVSDDADKGTIIDFALNRTGAKYWQVCQTLGDWVGGRAKRPDIKSYESNVVEQAYNPGRVANIFSRCTQGGGSAYLNSRGLDNETLNSDRFKGRVYSDRHGNVVFPHFRGKAICGLELKNADKAVFVRGGEKTLWRSNMFQDDETLIISEAVLDALSYHQIHKTDHVMYVATGGGLSPNQT